MRVGTWNMAGRKGHRQTEFLVHQDCDVLLLTEVPDGWSLPGYQLTPGGSDMGPKKRWAAIASRLPLVPISSPHPATTCARIADTTYVSSILPWSGSGGRHPWRGADHAARLMNTLEDLGPFLRTQTDLVWGGDWNHSLAGPEKCGSNAGRRALIALLAELALGVPTAGLGHRHEDLFTIDHVAMRHGVDQARRIVAVDGGNPLSDHDLYFVETHKKHPT